MTEADLRKLKTLAVAFHHSLKFKDFSGIGSNLMDFPKECCHHACNLLGAFLFENGFLDIQKVVGRHPDDPSPSGKHLWLNVGGVTVDITAYQFDGIGEEVIVTESSEWHLRLMVKSECFGMHGELLGDYLCRIRQYFNDRRESMYDDLASVAEESLQERSSEESSWEPTRCS